MDESERTKWNRSAVDYQRTFKLGLNEYEASLLSFLQENEMLSPGFRVIDIGCGAGVFGKYFAELGCDVTLTDISDEMIRFAKENMAPYENWTAFRADFNELELDHEALLGGFDLATAMFSPAVHDEDSVRKMSSISRGFCFLSRFFDWEQPFRKKLFEAIAYEPQEKFFWNMKGECAKIIEAVSRAGHTPHVKHTDYNWSDTRSIEEEADYLYRNSFSAQENGEELKEKAVKYMVETYGENAEVVDNVNAKVLWIYWKARNDNDS